MTWRLLLPLAAIHHAHTDSKPASTASPASSHASPPSPVLDLSSAYYPHVFPSPTASFHWSNTTLSPIVRFLRRCMLTAVHGSCRLHQRLNRLHCFELQRLHSHLPPSPSAPLITISNHASTIDDPWLITAIAPLPLLLSPLSCRFSWCTADICFSSPLRVLAFRLGHIFPIVRGAGLRQPGMTEALSHLCEGHWLHVFPEGRCLPGLAPRIASIRWGVAKLIVDAHSLGLRPVVVPFVHCGMERVLPLHSRLPRVGQDVWLQVGKEVEGIEDVIRRWREGERANAGWGDPWPRREEDLYAEIAVMLREAMEVTGEELRISMAATRQQRETA